MKESGGGKREGYGRAGRRVVGVAMSKHTGSIVRVKGRGYFSGPRSCWFDIYFIRK